MLRLKEIFKTGKPANKNNSGIEQPGQWHSLRTAKTLFPGRHISCMFDEYSIQLATVLQIGSQRRLLDVQKTYLPSSLENPEKRLAFITNCIEGYYKDFSNSFTSTSICLSGSETAFRTIELPLLSNKELRSAIKFEVSKHIPFPTDQSEFDYRVVQRFDKPGAERLRISVLAATNRLISESMQPFDQLGITVSAIYHTQDVVGQLLVDIPDFSPTEHYALINVGRERTEISYYEGSQLGFTHIANLGSSFISKRSDPTVLEYFGESLAAEIQNSLDFYAGQFSSHFTNKIFVYGDLAYADEIIELLSDRFGFSFSRFPADKLNLTKSKDSDFDFVLPVSLPSVAAASCRTKLANLLPQKNKQILHDQIINRSCIASTAIIFLLLFIGWNLMQKDINGTEHQLHLLTQTTERYEQSDAYKAYYRLKNQINAEQSYLEQVETTPSFMSENLKELSHLTNGNIRLVGFDYNALTEGQNLQLLGIVRGNETPPEIILAEYIETLQQSPFYENVTVVRHRKKKVNGRFEIEFQLSARGIV